MASVKYDLVRVYVVNVGTAKNPRKVYELTCPKHRKGQLLKQCDGCDCHIGVSFDPLAVKCEFKIKAEGGDEDEQDTGA